MYDVAEPGFGIEAVELGGLDQGIEGGGTITASVGPGKKVVFPAEGQRPDLPFGGVVVDLQPPVVEVAAQRRPEVAGVADGGGELALPRQLRQHRIEDGGEFIDQRQVHPHARRNRDHRRSRTAASRASTAGSIRSATRSTRPLPSTISTSPSEV